MIKFFHQFGSLPYFYRFSQKLIPTLAVLTWVCALLGLYLALVVAPMDYKQGEAFRIIYIHVPAAIGSMAIFTFMAMMALSYLIWHFKVCKHLLFAAVPIGGLLTFVALCTGALWGKPMWGTYWIWDARLTSEFILLLMYLAIMVVAKSITQPESRIKSVAVLVLIGWVDIPIIHFSVKWWATLHQDMTFTLMNKPKMDPAMLMPMYVCSAAFMCFFMWALLKRAQMSILEDSIGSKWVHQLKQKAITHA